MSERLDVVLDHLVYATPDLDASVAEFADRSGVRPKHGGRHPGHGSRNALVGLGADNNGRVRYLEIIGPDPDHRADPGVRLPFGLATLAAPRLVGWSVRTAHLDAAIDASAAAGADQGPARSMSRRTPSGARLQWRIASADPPPIDGIAPFLIDWTGSDHPAADPDLGSVELISLQLRHPRSELVGDVLDALGVRIPVATAPAAIVAVLETPRGLITLS